MDSANTIGRPQGTKNGSRSFIPLTVCHSWLRNPQTPSHWRRDVVSPSLPEDKTCKRVVEKSPVLAIEKIQDAQICWQSDGYGVLGPQGCTVGGFRGKKSQQSSVIFCNPRTVTSSHSTTTPCTAHNRCCFCRITHGHTPRLYHKSCSASGGQSWNSRHTA